MKIDGHRVELGEVELCLAAHEKVEAAVVLARSDLLESRLTLVAYVRCPSVFNCDLRGETSRCYALPHDLDKEIRSMLSLTLLPCMIPAFIVAMVSFPTGLSDKVDRRRLPSPLLAVKLRNDEVVEQEDTKSEGNDFTRHADSHGANDEKTELSDRRGASPGQPLLRNFPSEEWSQPNQHSELTSSVRRPSTSEVKQIYKLWRAVFKSDPSMAMEPHQNFFRAGGSSIVLVHLRQLLEEEFQCKISMADLLKAATPLLQAQLVQRLGNERLGTSTVADQKSVASSLSQAVVNEIRMPQPTNVHPVQASYTEAQCNDIAVVGLACNFPGACTADEFFVNLLAGRDCISDFLRNELLESGLPPEVIDSSDFVPAQGVLEDAEAFDASFFDFSECEAQLLDPQHRVFLQCCYHALEDAGLPLSQPGNHSVSVFVGAGASGVHQECENEFQTELSRLPETAAAIVAYKLGLTGMAVATQAACASSSVSVHLAAQSLLHGDSFAALAGGVDITFPQVSGYYGDPSGLCLLSPTGRCHSFDAEADGLVSGNGCGVLLLMRLADALNEGYSVRAVLRGSAVTNDGHDKSSPTASSPENQAKAIAMAAKRARVNLSDVEYVEAHGSGTRIGDLLEMQALCLGYRPQTESKARAFLGSVKSNVGHLGTAAGVAGIIKAILCLEHRIIPPSLHYQSWHADVDALSPPFQVPTECQPLSTDRPIVAVNSFGQGGNNVHFLFSQPPVSTSPIVPHSKAPQVVLLVSADSLSALASLCEEYAGWLTKKSSSVCLEDVQFTLACCRRHLRYRCLVSTNNKGNAVTKLRCLSRKAKQPANRAGTSSQRPSQPTTFALDQISSTQNGYHKRHHRPVIFLFPGQGSHFITMAIALYNQQPVFREALDYCATRVDPLIGFDLRNILITTVEERPEALEQAMTAFSQVLVFVVEFALVRFLKSSGVECSAVVGHSSGEYMAAVVSGVLSVDDALNLVVQRNSLMNKVTGEGGRSPGRMLAATVSKETAVELSDQFSVSMAAINCNNQVVFSGGSHSIGKLAEHLRSRRVRVRQLATDDAYHSPAMTTTAEQYANVVSKVTHSALQTPWFSSATGREVVAKNICVKFWCDQIVQPVLFADALHRAMSVFPNAVFLEVGPGKVLTSFAQNITSSAEKNSWLVLPPILPKKNAPTWLESLGVCWLNGVVVNWACVFQESNFPHWAKRRVHLPLYPFAKQIFPAVCLPPLSKVACPLRSLDETDAGHGILSTIEHDPVSLNATQRTSPGLPVSSPRGKHFHANTPIWSSNSSPASTSQLHEVIREQVYQAVVQRVTTKYGADSCLERP